MKFNQPLIEGTLIKRYKRFLADVRLQTGETVTAHCPNSGSMKSVSQPGSPVMLSLSGNPKRKLKYTLELIRVSGNWVGINTVLPNRLVQEGIETSLIPELLGYSIIRREVNYGSSSRIDLLLESAANKCYVEVKNVTLKVGDTAIFPDSVTRRGQKHLRELMAMVREEHRAVIFFLVQRGDCIQMAPADSIDPRYGELLREAHAGGVEILVYQARVSPQGIQITRRLPVILDRHY